MREVALKRKIKAQLLGDEEIPENTLFEAFFNKKLSAEKFADLLAKEANNNERYLEFADLLLSVNWTQEKNVRI